MGRQDAEYRPELRSRVYMAGRKDIHIFKALCLELVARQKNTSLGLGMHLNGRVST